VGALLNRRREDSKSKSRSSSGSKGGRPSTQLSFSPSLAQLALVDRRGRAGERVRARCGLREGDHVADRVGSVHEGHDAVQAVGDPAVRRRAEAKRVEQEAEPLLRLIVIDADRGEHAALKTRVVDADRSTANFPTVPHDIVCLGPAAPGHPRQIRHRAR
jgi:hypothetical protein